jgi:hypothetical protein
MANGQSTNGCKGRVVDEAWRSGRAILRRSGGGDAEWLRVWQRRSREEELFLAAVVFSFFSDGGCRGKPGGGVTKIPFVRFSSK